MIVVLATFLSAAMFYLSQGLNNVWVLAWFAPAPLLWLAYGKAPTWQVVVASLVAVLSGTIYVLQCYFPMLPPVIYLQVIGPQAVLFPLAVVFARKVQRRRLPIVTLFAFPACWTAFEYLSGVIAPNGTFGSFAYSQVSAPALIQIASLFGLYAVTFLICLFANMFAMGLRMKRAAAFAIGIGAAICAANIAFGFVRLAQPQGETIRVAAMVDETAQVEALHARTLPQALAVSTAYANAIRHAAGEGAKFVVTPEAGILVSAQTRTAILAPLVTVAKQTGTQIIAGVVQIKPMADIAFSILPDGSLQQYDKRHLVPFVENMFTPGHRSGWLGNGRGMEICKDMDFPSTIRHDAAHGIRLLGVPAGDFGKDAWLHARMSVMRGVEDGFALVRAAHQGLVTASDAEGRLVAAKMAAPTGLTTIVTDLPLGPGPTLYVLIGDAFAWFCTAFTLLIGIYALYKWKRFTRQGSIATRRRNLDTQ